MRLGISIIFLLIGIVGCLIARIQLGNSYSFYPKVTKLVTTGLYSKIRHPIYFFSLFNYIGLIIYIDFRLLLFLIPICIIQAHRIYLEEKLLVETFSQEYRDYKERTWF